jgi:hypothetical protein
MSTAALQRQIDRLASTICQIKPRTIIHYKLIGRPSDDATDEAKAVYQAELAAALVAGMSVIELVGIKPGQTKRRWQRPEDRQSRL